MKILLVPFHMAIDLVADLWTLVLLTRLDMARRDLARLEAELRRAVLDHDAAPPGPMRWGATAERTRLQAERAQALEHRRSLENKLADLGMAVRR